MKSPQRIKPLLTHQISIKGLSSYQSFLLRRPKNAQTLKFSVLDSEFPLPWNQEVRRHQKLLKALELAKPMRKIDLSQVMLKQDYSEQRRLFSAFKRNSKVKVVYLFKFLNGEDDVEKSFRYLKELQYQRYQIEGSIGVFTNLFNPLLIVQPSEHPSKSLRCCSKLRRIMLANEMKSYCFQRTAKQLPWLAMKNLFLNRTLPCSTANSLSELVSVSLREPQKIFLDLAQELPNLQEIQLKLNNPLRDSEFSKMLQKFTEKTSLKKVNLCLNAHFYNLDEIFEAFYHTRLTYFSLRVYTTASRPPASLIALLRRLNQLESLKLDLTHSFSDMDPFNPENELRQLCEQINKLQSLRHLKLHFNSAALISKKEKRISNFFPHLYPLFMKPVKLEALSISCNQIAHSESFVGLITALQGLSASLRKLKLDIGGPSISQKSHKIAVDLIKSLPNLKVLNLPCLAFKLRQSFNVMVQAVLGLKSLEVLYLGEIHKDIEVPVYLNAMRDILCKGGLRKFHCQTTNALCSKILNEIENHQKEHSYDMKKIMKSNPSLEYVFLLSYDRACGSRFTYEIVKWYAEEQRYCDLFIPF